MPHSFFSHALPPYPEKDRLLFLAGHPNPVGALPKVEQLSIRMYSTCLNEERARVNLTFYLISNPHWEETGEPSRDPKPFNTPFNRYLQRERYLGRLSSLPSASTLFC